MTEHQDPQRRISFAGIVLALMFLAIASIGVTRDPFWLLNEATKWIAAGTLALIGVGLVATTLPGLRKR